VWGVISFYFLTGKKHKKEGESQLDRGSCETFFLCLASRFIFSLEDDSTNFWPCGIFFQNKNHFFLE